MIIKISVCTVKLKYVYRFYRLLSVIRFNNKTYLVYEFCHYGGIHGHLSHKSVEAKHILHLLAGIRYAHSRNIGEYHYMPYKAYINMSNFLQSTSTKTAVTISDAKDKPTFLKG